MKSTDVATELRPFLKLFNQVAYRHDYSRVYDDFLTIAYTQFVPKGIEQYEKENADAIKAYSFEEQQLLMQMFHEMLRVVHNQIGDPEREMLFADAPGGRAGGTRCRGIGWYDFFGDFYQELTSRGKSSAMGQFFTPENVVELMRMLVGGEEGKTGQLISDPCCGSGRMLLSYHAHHPGNRLYAQDLDRMCCKMTLLNLLIHGGVGEVQWGNSLDPDDVRQAWRVNPYLNNPWHHLHGIPHILPLEKEQSHVWQLWEARRLAIAAGTFRPEQVPTAPAPRRSVLTLFEGLEEADRGRRATPVPKPQPAARGPEKAPAEAADIQLTIF